MSANVPFSFSRYIIIIHSRINSVKSFLTASVTDLLTPFLLLLKYFRNRIGRNNRHLYLYHLFELLYQQRRSPTCCRFLYVYTSLHILLQLILSWHILRYKVYNFQGSLLVPNTLPPCQTQQGSSSQ